MYYEGYCWEYNPNPCTDNIQNLGSGTWNVYFYTFPSTLHCSIASLTVDPLQVGIKEGLKHGALHHWYVLTLILTIFKIRPKTINGTFESAVQAKTH